jgi:hypothetical protein
MVFCGRYFIYHSHLLWLDPTSTKLIPNDMAFPGSLFGGNSGDGGEPGSGTVTQFSAGNLSPIFSTNVINDTTTPQLSFTLTSQSANVGLFGPTSGGAAAPTFRSLVAADLPDLSGLYIPLAGSNLITGNLFSPNHPDDEFQVGRNEVHNIEFATGESATVNITAQAGDPGEFPTFYSRLTAASSGGAGESIISLFATSPSGTRSLGFNDTSSFTFTGADVRYAADYSPSYTARSFVDKAYVDNLATGLSWKTAVRAATTANITLSGTQTVDGVALQVGDRILVKNQTDATENGIYIVAAGAWARAEDANTGTELWGSAVYTQSGGVVNGGTQWANSNSSAITIGVTNITFGQIAGAGVYASGTGLTLTGNVFAIDSTVATLTGIQILTNKTLTAPQINFGSDANYDVIYRNNSGVTTRLPLGANGTALGANAGALGYYTPSSLVGSQNASFFWGSPTGASGNLTPRYINTLDLNYQFTTFGSIFTDNFAGSAYSGYTTFGTPTVTPTAGGLTLSKSGVFTLNDGIRKSGVSGFAGTCIQVFDLVARFTVGTIDANSHGIAIGVQSTATGTAKSVQFVLRLNTANQGKLQSYMDNSTLATYMQESNDTLTVASTNTVACYLARIDHTFIFKVINEANGQVITLERLVTLPPNGNFNAPNTGQFSVYICGGTHTLLTNSASSTQRKGVAVLVAGDSIVNGAGASNTQNTYTRQLDKMIQNGVATWGGGGNRVEDIDTANLILYGARVIVLEGGINNLAVGQTAAAITAAMLVKVQALQAAGYVLGSTLFIEEVLPNSAYLTVAGLNAAYLAQFGADAMIYFYKSMLNVASSGMLAKYLNPNSGDTTHPSDRGHLFKSETLFQQLLNKGAVIENFDPRSMHSAVYKSDGKMMIGTDYCWPYFALHVIETAKTQIHFGISPVDPYGGGTLTSTTAGSCFLTGGAYFEAGAWMATHTDVSQISVSNGTFLLRRVTGTTAGTDITASFVDTMRLSNTGQVLLGGTTTSRGYATIEKSYATTASITAEPSLYIWNTSASQGNGTTTQNRSVLSVSAGNAAVSAQLLASYNSAGFGQAVVFGTFALNPLVFAINGLDIGRIDTSANLLWGTASSPASATKAMAMSNGVAPSGSVTDAFLMYSADRGGTAGKAGMHIRSEDGTSSVISDRVGLLGTSPTRSVGVFGDLALEVAGNGLYIKEGSNATMGTGTLVAGTVTINTTKVTANSRIFITRSTAGGTLGELSYTISAGVSFTVTSISALETSTFNWIIIEPN